MAVEFITTDQNTFYTIDDTDIVFVVQGVTMTSAGSAFSDSLTTSAQLFFDGNAYTGNDLWDFGIGSNEVTVAIGENATVITSGDGLLGGASVLKLTNSGFMQVDEAGFYVTSGAVTTIANHGTLISQGETSQGAIYVLSTNGTTITNTGLIQTFGLTFTDAAVKVSANTTISNSGSIIAGTDNAIYASGVVSVTNTGTIQGVVNLGVGDDVFNTLGGHVEGTVLGGGGNDTFYVDDAELAIDGGADIDTLISYASVLNATGFESITLRGTGNFSAIGDASTIEMTGNSGNNDLTGSTLANAMMGGGGHDVIEGLAGNDTLRGNGGDDVLNGGNSDDYIFGGTGNDTIYAGNGRDILRGEQGADTFVYEGVSEFGNPLTRDIILGFERGKDSIDISAIDDASFDFIGTAAFSGTGLEVRYYTLGAGHSVVEFDADADGISDGELLVRGVLSLDAGDFVL